MERSTDYTPIHDDKCALTRKLVINKRVENGKLQFVKQDGMPMEFKILRELVSTSFPTKAIEECGLRVSIGMIIVLGRQD